MAKTLTVTVFKGMDPVEIQCASKDGKDVSTIEHEMENAGFCVTDDCNVCRSCSSYEEIRFLRYFKEAFLCKVLGLDFIDVPRTVCELWTIREY